MSDIHDYDGLEDEPFPPLPPPLSPDQEGGQEQGGPFGDEEEGEASKLADIPAAKRKGVKRPQPKLDSNRLISENGLPALRTLFDNIQFKGKGHEVEDLKLLMQKMENWAHRLYPRLQFEDFIEKVEKLGNKKEVQTCLKRIRLDMPLTHEDFGDKNDEDNAPPEPLRFEDLNPFGSESSVPDSQGPIHSTPAPAASPPPSLTEEQRRRMELNRQRALEKRLARQHQQTELQTVSPTSSGNELTTSSPVTILKGPGPEEKQEDVDPEMSRVQLPPKDPQPPADSPDEAPASEPHESSVKPPESPNAQRNEQALTVTEPDEFSIKPPESPNAEPYVEAQDPPAQTAGSCQELPLQIDGSKDQ